jgi:type IV pilus assembly protein PilV
MALHNLSLRHSGQRGFTLIEILVTLVITAFGLLALAGFITKATTLTADSVQRARAGVLLSDIVGRISNHKALAAKYADGKVRGETVASCDKLTDADLDLCEWNNLLAGANDGGSGAKGLGYRGCITGGVNLYTVTVVWGSLTPGVPPHENVSCAKDVFDDDSFRRTLQTQIRIAELKATP